MPAGLSRAPRRSRFMTIVLAIAAVGTALPATVAPQAVHAASPPPTPTLTSLSPEAGPTTGGTTVTISGGNFEAGVTTVSFGSVAATSVNVLSSTQLTAVTPIEDEGQVQVTATNATVTSTASAPATTFQFTSPGPFVPLTARICDTQSDGNTTLCAGHTIAANSSLPVQVTGVGGIPASGVAAVAMDLFTAPTIAGSYGNVAVQPAGLAGGGGDLSWVNGNYGTLLVETPVGLNGQVLLVNNSPNSGLNVILDVQGYVADSQTDASGLLNPITPARTICNTAANSGTCEVQNNAGWGGGTTNTFQVLGQGGVPAATQSNPTGGVSAVVLDIQTYAENNAGWLVAYPSGESRPVTASMLWNAWTPVTNHIIVPVDSTGTISVYNGEAAGSGTQVSISVEGWFTDSSNPSATGGLYYPNNGTLICDTRAGSGTGTPCANNGQLSSTNSPMGVQVTGLAGVPAPSAALTGVELEITVTNVNLPSGVGTNVCVSASATSCSENDLNLYGGVPADLLVIVPVDSSGKVWVYTPTGSMDVLVVVTGYEYDPTQASTPSSLPVIPPAAFTANPSAYPQLNLQGATYAAEASQEKTSPVAVDSSAPEFTASASQGNTANAPTETRSYYILQSNVQDQYHRAEQRLGLMQPSGTATSATLSYGSVWDGQDFADFPPCKVTCEASDASMVPSAEAFIDGYVQNIDHLRGTSFALVIGLNNSGNATQGSVQYANSVDWYNQLFQVEEYASAENSDLAKFGFPLRLYVWAGDDIEDGGGFNVPPAATLQWIKGFQDQDMVANGNTQAISYIKVIDFGGWTEVTCQLASCWDTPVPTANNWTQHYNWEAMYGGPTDQLNLSPVWPAPEIYDTGWWQYYVDLDNAASAEASTNPMITTPNYLEVTWSCGGFSESHGQNAWADFVTYTGHHPGSLTGFHVFGNQGTSGECT